MTDLTTPIDNKIWLSDIGINQLIEAGLLKGIEPYPNKKGRYDGPINPVTLNLPPREDIEIGRFERRMIHHAPLELGPDFSFSGDLRSRMRRSGLGTTEYCAREGALMVYNLSWQAYSLRKSDLFCQVFIGGSPESSVSEFEHGRVLIERAEIDSLLREGHIEFSETNTDVCITDSGFLVLHVSNVYEELENDVRTTINPTNTPKFLQKTKKEIPQSGVFLHPQKPFELGVEEIVKLSSQVALQLFFKVSGNSDLNLGGVVDPGFEGRLRYFPLLDRSVKVSPGDPLVFARAIYFEKPVKMPYGHPDRLSLFQGT